MLQLIQQRPGVRKSATSRGTAIVHCRDTTFSYRRDLPPQPVWLAVQVRVKSRCPDAYRAPSAHPTKQSLQLSVQWGTENARLKNAGKGMYGNSGAGSKLGLVWRVSPSPSVLLLSSSSLSSFPSFSLLLLPFPSILPLLSFLSPLSSLFPLPLPLPLHPSPSLKVGPLYSS